MYIKFAAVQAAQYVYGTMQRQLLLLRGHHLQKLFVIRTQRDRDRGRALNA
jgi:hypothetical protein